MARPAPPRLRHRVGPIRSGAGGVGAAAVAGLLVGLVVGMAVTGADGPATGSTLRWGLPAARAVLDAAGVVAVGSGTVGLLLSGVRRAGDVLTTLRRGAVVVGTGWAVAALVVLWLQVAQATGQEPRAVRADRFGDYVQAVAAGRALLVAASCGLTVALMAAVALRRPSAVPVGLPVVPAVLGVLVLPISGHAVTGHAHGVAVHAVAVHVAAVSVWVGGFTVLVAVLLPHRELLAATLPRFSRLAAGCLVVVAVTGLLTATLQVDPTGGPTAVALITSSYGALLFAKTVGVLALAALGGWARRRLLPAVAARRPVGVAGWIGVELAVMGAVLGLAAVLAGSAPPT